MTIGLVGQDQITTFTSPVNGTSPIDANVVRGNDNTVKTAHNVHDFDATIHFQSSLNVSRPPAGVPGRKWLDTDTRRVYYDDGITWNEIGYISTGGGGGTGIPGPVVITGGGITTDGGITAAGDISAGGNVIAHTLFIAEGTAAQNRGTVARTAGVTRWFVGANAAAETGGNAGSDLSIAAYTDAGALLREVLVVRRDTGIATWNVTEHVVAPAAGDAIFRLQSVTGNAVTSLNTNGSHASTVYNRAGVAKWGVGLGTGTSSNNFEWFNYPVGGVTTVFDVLTGAVTCGVVGARQTSARLAARGHGNGVEWGHDSPGGFASVLGAEFSSGAPFVALSGEAGTTVNTYRSRGNLPGIIRVVTPGQFEIGSLASANADNQSFISRLRLDLGNGVLTAMNYISTSGISVASGVGIGAPASMYGSPAHGLILFGGAGSTNCLILANNAGGNVMVVPVGSARANFAGDVDVASTVTATNAGIRGSIVVGSAGVGTAGSVRYTDDGGTQRFFSGILGAAGTRAWSIYDLIRGAEVMNVNGSNGAITWPGLNNGAMSVGAADSGGAGFRMLRVPN